jgi:hypothetical protein
MEPRWNAKEWAGHGYTYLGGTNEFDMWFDDEEQVRVVWGTSIMEWDYFDWSHKAEAYLWKSEDKDYVDHDEVLVEALTYLRCFAPWVEQEMTK